MTQRITPPEDGPAAADHDGLIEYYGPWRDITCPDCERTLWSLIPLVRGEIVHGTLELTCSCSETFTVELVDRSSEQTAQEGRDG